MTNTAANQSQGRGPLRRLRTRLHERLDTKSERGDLLIEVVIAIAVIGTTLASYTTSNMTMEHVSRSRTAVDITAQQAQGVLQAAKSAPWDRLGFATADPGYRNKFGTLNTVTHSLPAAENDDLVPLKEVERGNITMTQRTDVVWEKCPAGSGSSCGATTPSGSYGTKKVVVTITYRVPGTSVDKTRTYTMSRSSSVAEADPFAGPAAPPPPPACPNVTSTAGSPLAWTAVTGATQYRLNLNDGQFVYTYTTPVASGVTHVVGSRVRLDITTPTHGTYSCNLGVLS